MKGNPLKYTDPNGLNPGAGAGAAGGFVVGGPAGAVVGGIIGFGVGIVGAKAGWDYYNQNKDTDEPAPIPKPNEDTSDCGCSKILDRRNSWHDGDWIYWEYQECLRNCKKDKECEK